MSDSNSDRKLPKPRNNKYPPAKVTLEMMVRALVEEYGWADLGQKIFIKCFNENPSLKSSMIFLKQTEWARLTVEDLYNWRFGGRPADWVGPAPRPHDDGNSGRD